ncbi:MAG: hypothetical protein WC346_05380 [Methanogenium sp.]|jgi:hypothetical protein
MLYIYHFISTSVATSDSEYIYLTKDVNTEAAEITRPGFKLDKKYEFDTVSDFPRLPLERELYPH